MSIQNLPVSSLAPHPENPRMGTDWEIVNRIAKRLRMAGEFDEAHALIVRPLDGGFQIVSGHRRALAADAAGIKDVPCHIREMTDEDAYLALALENDHESLSALEEGFHAANSKLSVREYAKRVGKTRNAIEPRIRAAKVANDCLDIKSPDLAAHWSALAEIHAAPESQRPRLAREMIAGNWTVEQTRNEVKKVKLARKASEKRANDEREKAKAKPGAPLNISLEQWQKLDKDVQRQHLDIPPARIGNFNKQENTRIEWAQFSWNPITGCLHDCPYCYARDIAQSARTASAFPNGFEPTIRPESLFRPRKASLPQQAETDVAFRNVFTCSMADLFGRWVPREWIEAVLREIRSAPQWNFLCLTKFPKRMAEFDIPPNAWMGTTVDLQARIPNAEAAFANVKSGVRWLSVEPMLEPLRFKNIDRFDWLVIGGASRSTETPAWIPPVSWVFDLVRQAREAKLKIYMKDNLGIEKRIVEFPYDAPIGDLFKYEESAPAEFHYLGKRAAAA